jgi:hypothetical protein
MEGFSTCCAGLLLVLGVKQRENRGGHALLRRHEAVEQGLFLEVDAVDAQALWILDNDSWRIIGPVARFVSLIWKRSARKGSAKVLNMLYLVFWDIKLQMNCFRIGR